MAVAMDLLSGPSSILLGPFLGFFRRLRGWFACCLILGQASFCLGLRELLGVVLSCLVIDFLEEDWQLL